MIDYVRHELVEEQRAQVEAHLGRCASCRRLVSETVKLGCTASDAALAATLAADATEHDPLLGLRIGDRVDRYVLLEVVGRGATGVVYAAHDERLERRIALKVLHLTEVAGTEPGYRDRLLDEAQAMAKLSHPNVVSVYDAGTFGARDDVFLAMELVTGGTLREWLAARPRRPWRDIVSIFASAGRGLAAAHALGLVHRDFKPENVLVSRIGGRDVAKVTDFGLVTYVESNPTETGARVGTPRYMAPEQHAAVTADARADQFSFCASLWEALYGEAPFAGTTYEVLAASVLAGERREAPRSHVPRRVRRALTRGLLRRPEDRFASMDALVAELDRALTASRLRSFGTAGAAAIGIAGIVAATVGRPAPAPSCDAFEGDDAVLSGVWNPAVARAVEDRFLATNLPYAKDTFTRVSAQIDRYRTSLGRARKEACEATHVRGEQSPELLDRRMRCLDRSVRQLDALVHVWTTSSELKALDGAVVATQNATDLGGCTNLEALDAIAPPPSNVRDAVEAVDTKLAQATALWHSLRREEALSIANDAVTRAREIGYQPKLADALYLRGVIENDDRHFPAAEATFREAVRAATAAGNDRIIAEAWSQLAIIVGGYGKRFAETEWIGLQAELAANRTNDPRVRIAWLNAMAKTLRAAAKVEQARDRLEEALTLAERMFGSDDDRTSTIALNLGMILMDLRRYPEAERYLRRSLDSAVARLGPKHPDVADRRRVLAIALHYEQQPTKALAELEQALPVLEASLGRDNGDVSMLVYTMADILRHAQRCREAVPYYRRAIAYAEHALDESDEFRPYPLFGLARCLDQMGQGREAVELLTRARSFALKAGASAQDVAVIDLAMSHALATSDRRRAATLATAARAAIAEDDAEESAPLIEELVAAGVLPSSARPRADRVSSPR